MQKRKLGNSGISIAPLVFGGNVFGWTAGEPASFELLDAFVDSGFDCIDTADVYSTWVPGHQGGESETIIGNWLKRTGHRERVIIATKAGKPMPTGKGLSKAHIMRAVEDSLKRLQTDYIDLYQSHEDDPATPFEETFSAFGKLIEQGKVRAIGASNYTADRLAASIEASRKHGLPSYQTLQPWYNLYDRQEYESSLEPVCEQYGLGVICYYALASGFLTGKYRTEADLKQSARGQGVKKYLNDRGFRILAALDDVAAKCQSTPARVALAWPMARSSITAPIASATRLDQLRDLVEAAELRLDAASMEILNKASAWREAI